MIACPPALLHFHNHQKKGGSMSKPPVVRPPGREVFFASLETFLDPREMEQVGFAYYASKYGHRPQERDDGSRYFDHPKRAAWIYINELGGRDPDVIIILLLHDILEDSYLLSSYRINVNFAEKNAIRVRALTKMSKGKETLEEYIARIVATDVQTVLAKLLDRLDNLRSLSGCAIEKQKKQIRESKEIILPKLLSALRSHGVQYSMYADYIEKEAKKAMDAVIASWKK